MPKKIGGKSLPKNIWKICTTESLKRHSQPKDWEEESRPKAFEDLITKMPSKTFLLPNFFLKRNPYQTNFNRTCTKKILNKTCPPQTFWREVCTKQFRKKTPQKKEQIGQKYVMWHLYPKIVEGKILPKYIWSKVLHRTICEGKLSTKQTLNKSFSKQFQKKPLPKNIWGNMPTKHR